MANIHLPIRQLVEFLLRTGSIDSRFAGFDRANEGARIHRKLQKAAGEGYQAEVFLSAEREACGIAFTLEGRADGIFTDENGIVTIDEAISILQDEASEDIAKMNAIGPSDKPYFKQSMWDLYKSRAPWLLFLMISATFSSLVIRGYEDALAAVTVLTAYIPMLTDAGGNAGSQSTSTIIRGMAVGDIQPHDLPRILWRESRVALLCGGTLAVCNFVKLLLFDRIAAPVALVVCLTLICTILLSQIIGGILPVAAEKLHVDPAVMASPLITTIVDTTTLLIYFNIAKMLLHL